MKKTSHKKASTLSMVLILTAAVAMILSSTLSYSIFERRVNYEHFLIQDAKMAAESGIQFGLAKVIDMTSRNYRIDSHFFHPDDGKPLLLHDDLEMYLDMFDNDIVADEEVTFGRLKYPSEAEESWGKGDTVVLVGPITDWRREFVDPNLSSNTNSPVAGMWVQSSYSEVLAKATMERPNGKRKTAYARQIMQIADSPLFNYAAFWNFDAELHPAPKMEFLGPVHVNGDFFVATKKGIDFLGRTSLSGDILPTGKKFEDMSKNGFTGDAFFSEFESDPENGDLVTSTNLLTLNSRLANFREDALNTWPGGGLKTGDHQIADYKIPMDVPEDPDEEDLETEAVYQIIQRKVPGNDSPLEQQKFYNKAGLIVEVDVSSGGSAGNGDVTFYYRNGSNLSKLNVPMATQTALVDVQNFARDGSTKEVVGGLFDPRRGSIVLEEGEVNTVVVDMAELKRKVEGNNPAEWDIGGSVSPEKFWNGVVHVDIFDKSKSLKFENPDTKVIEVSDYEKKWGVLIKNGAQLPNPDGTLFSRMKGWEGLTFVSNAPAYIQGNYNSNGVVIPGGASEPDDPKDALVDIVSGGPYQEVPSAIIADAVTFLSNEWTQAKSGYANNPDKRRVWTDVEVSSAILAGQMQPTNDKDEDYPGVSWPIDGKDSQGASGGIQNFPRIMEFWGNWKTPKRPTLQIRGSMVALFESRIANQMWHYANGSAAYANAMKSKIASYTKLHDPDGKQNNLYFFEPPIRDWGFHSLFAQGNLPPETPNIRIPVEKQFFELSASEYNKHLKRIQSAFGK